MKNLEWNMAFEGNEDWKAAMSSEIFRNFVKTVTSKTYEDEKPLVRNEDYVDNDYIEKMISEAQDKTLEMENEILDVDPDVDLDESSDEDSDVDPDEDSDETINDTFVEKTLNEYETDAGKSDFIEIGLTDKTMKDIKNDGVMSASFVKEVMNVYKDEEVAEAEKELGLDTNAAYIFSKEV